MTKARHRLTALRHAEDADIGFAGIDVYPNNQTVHTIAWHPTEDITLHNVRSDLGTTYTHHGSNLGGTGTTSATFLIDQDVHDFSGSSSDAYFKVGAAYTQWVNDNEFIDFSYDFNPSDGEDGYWRDGYLSTPAKRCTMYFKSTDWHEFWESDVGTATADNDGCTTGDSIYNATLTLTVDSVTIHDPQGESVGNHNQQDEVRPPTAPIEQCRGDVAVYVQRVVRGSSAEGASNGYTAGSMSDMAWWSYKGGDTLSAYWGYSGGNSGGTYTADPQDTADLDSSSGISFTQLWDVETGHQYHIDVTDLVSDAMTNRTGDLRLMLHYPYDCNDATTAYNWPNTTEDPTTFTHWINETTYHSKNSSQYLARPRIDITYLRSN